MATWKSYEEIAAFLLNQCASELGLARVEGKQTVRGYSANWEIDAKGVREGTEGFIIIECRRYTTSKPSQEQLGGLAYRIKDAGASGGIIVTPLGIQEGAARIAASENILEVQLSADCTPDEFVMRFLNKLMVGVKETVVLRETVVAEVSRKCQTCGRIFNPVGSETACPVCRGID